MGAALEATADWLGAALLSALMRISHGSPEIRLVAVGHLNVLPLQIARRPDCSAPTGYRYLADELLVSFLPSAKFLPAAPGTQRAAPPDRGAVLIDAKDPTLGGTSRELDAIAEALGPRSQRREVGDPSALIAALRRSSDSASSRRSSSSKLWSGNTMVATGSRVDRATGVKSSCHASVCDPLSRLGTNLLG
jgi:hypothetical protein